MNPYWTFVKTVGEYNVWTSPDGYYQVTKTKTPPDSTAGYANLETLLKMKGIKTWDTLKSLHPTRSL